MTQMKSRLAWEPEYDVPFSSKEGLGVGGGQPFISTEAHVGV